MQHMCKGQVPFFSCLTALLLTFCIPISVEASSWSPPINLSMTGANTAGVQVATDTAGHEIAIWSGFNGENYIIRSATKHYESNTWSPEQDVSLPGGDAFCPQIAFDAKGNAIAIWSKKIGDDSVIQTATKPLKKGWSLPMTISSLGALNHNALFPQIETDKNGNAYAVWQANDGKRNVIQYATKGQNRISWSAPVTLSSSTSPGLGDIRPQLAVDHAGNVIVVWTNTETLAVQSVEQRAGHRWSAPTTISHTGSSITGAQIGIDQMGNAVVVWTRSDGDNMIVQAASKPFSSTSWSSPVNLSLPGEDAISPCLTVNSTGNALAVWQRFDGSYSIIQAATKHGNQARWSPPFDLTATGEDAGNAKAALNSTNAAVIAWKRSDGTNFVIQASTTAHGNVWSNPSTLSLTGEDAVAPQVGIDDSGNASVVWLRSDGTNTLVQAAERTINQQTGSGS